VEVVESPIPPPLPAVIPVKLPTPPPTLERPPRGTRLSRLYRFFADDLVKDSTPPSPRTRSDSPSPSRRPQFRPSVLYPRSYTVEAICALPHPVPTHSLASTPCMTHLLTGSEDGYIRDYDIFTAVNGKVFLTAPQRHHAGVVEGTLKSGQVRSWWENPGTPAPPADAGRSPVHSLALHSEALWGLSGTDVRNFVRLYPFIGSPLLQSGKINLFTVRHEPGRLFHVMQEHRGPVSALSLQHDQRGFFSAGWDGQAIVGYTFTDGSLGYKYPVPAMGPRHRQNSASLRCSCCTAGRARSPSSGLRLSYYTSPVQPDQDRQWTTEQVISLCNRRRNLKPFRRVNR
jgi:WD40 repeat protein